MNSEIRASVSMKLKTEDTFILPVVFESQDQLAQLLQKPFIWLTPETYAGRNSPKIIFPAHINRINIEPPRMTTLNDKKEFYRVGLSQQFETGINKYKVTCRFAASEYSFSVQMSSLEHLHTSLLKPFFSLVSLNPQKQQITEVILTSNLVRIDVEPEFSNDIYANLDLYQIQ
ncbi:hypothetical protein bcgnr5390_16140 [Bacillus luti]|nr:hypothetical protein BC2903_53400 [Bacillus cereus]